MIITIMTAMITKVIIITNNSNNSNNGVNINIGIDFKNQDQVEIKKMK